MCWRARSHPSPRRSRSLRPPWGSVANDMPASRRPSRTLAKLLGLAGVRTVSVIDKEAHTVLAAFSRYGKGRGHPAQLNLGDCFAYSAAVQRRRFRQDRSLLRCAIALKIEARRLGGDT